MEAFPHLSDKIVGAEYKGLPQWRSWLSSAAAFSAWGVMLLVIAGLDRICEMTGVAKESLSPTVVQLFENKGAAIVGFLVLNSLSTQLMASGAFEIFLEDAATGRKKEIWSTIANGGRIPQPAQTALLLRDAGLIMSPAFEARLLR